MRLACGELGKGSPHNGRIVNEGKRTDPGYGSDLFVFSSAIDFPYGFVLSLLLLTSMIVRLTRRLRRLIASCIHDFALSRCYLRSR